jgi:hypothetical protein
MLSSAAVPGFLGATAARPATAGSPQTRGGTFVDCRDFAGLDSTGQVASDTAINAAIAAGITERLPVFLASGTYRIANPIVANPLAIRAGYANLQFFGAGGLGSLDPPGSPSRALTIISADFTDRPAISLELMSGARLTDFALQGKNTAPNAVVLPLDEPSAYIGADCRDNRFSPYCAIAIDALNSTDVPDPDRYPRMTDYYFKTGGGSVGITIENVWIANFVVGIAYGISGLLANTEDIDFHNVWISRVDSCYAVGHSQARHCLMRMGNLGFARQGIDGCQYGAQLGCPPKFDRVNHGYLYRIFSLPNSVGNFVLDDNYAESIRTLGNFGVGAGYSRQPLSFLGGDYTITSKELFRTAPPPLLLESYSPTVFKAVGITQDANSKNVDALNVVVADAVCSLEQCFLPGSGIDRVPPFIGLVKDASHVQCRLLDCYTASADGGALYISDDLPRSPGLSTLAPGGRLCATYLTRWVGDGNRDYLYQPHEPDNLQYPISVQALTLDRSGAGSVSFKSADSHLLEGDVLFWRMRPQGISRNQWVVPALKVRSIQAASVRCDLLYDPLEYDSVEAWNQYNPGRMFIVVRQWAPARALTATLNDSRVITDLSAPEVLIGNAPGSAGDWLAGTGIRPFTRVISVDQRAATALLSQPTAGGPAKEIALYFGRLRALQLSSAI